MGLIEGVQPLFEWFRNFITIMPDVIQVLLTFTFGSLILIAFLKFLFALFHR